MALIKCPECGKEVSSMAPTCPNCGCPIKKEETSIRVKASSQFIGLACSYIIYDSNENEIAKLKPGESFSKVLPDKQQTLYVKIKGYFGGKKEMPCEPNVSNKFSVGVSQSGLGCVVSKVDFLDSRD